MFPLNTILAWNINNIMNKKYDNNNIIIASRANFLQRQGDLLSPLLFVLVLDVLAAMFQAAEQARALTELSALGLKHHVSLYANDIMVFARSSEEELVAVREILACFGAASGIDINYAKSSIGHIRCSEVQTAAMAPLLRCPTNMLPCTYLGLFLSVRAMAKAEL
jgi:hypothetical protein